MQVSGIPSSLRNKYPQFRTGETTKPVDQLAVNLQYQKKVAELTEKLQKTSPLWPILGENLVTLTNFNGHLNLRLDFLDLDNLRSREKANLQLAEFFFKHFQTPEDWAAYSENYRKFIEDDEKVYGHHPANPKISTRLAGELQLKGGDRYFVRQASYSHLFQYLLNRDQATYANFPQGEWDYQLGKMKHIYVAVFRATREWNKY